MTHTPGPWKTRLYFQDEADLAELQELGIEPTKALTNDGARAVMAGETRVALIDCQTKFKRGQGHRSDCPERDANARLIAAAPELLAAIKPLAFSDTKNPPPGVESTDWRAAVHAARTALAAATCADEAAAKTLRRNIALAESKG